MEIREVGALDLDGIIAVSRECGIEAGMKPMSKKVIEDLWFRSLAEELVSYVAVQDGEIVGAVVAGFCCDNFSVDTEVAIIHICVDKSERYSGVFSAFINKYREEFPGKTISLTLPKKIRHKLLKPVGYVYEVK